jgi:hypothetical protein
VSETSLEIETTFAEQCPKASGNAFGEAPRARSETVGRRREDEDSIFLGDYFGCRYGWFEEASESPYGFSLLVNGGLAGGTYGSLDHTSWTSFRANAQRDELARDVLRSRQSHVLVRLHVVLKY